jgi:hypothetical protein
VSSASIKKFFWQNIICRYGIPRHITVDNAKYFDNAMFRDFSKQIGMKVVFTSVYHPQANGAVEAIKKILEGEKKRKMGRGHANRSVEPQHHSVQSNKFLTFLVNVWS